jgi:phage/plasmid-associated DNA primase
MACNTMPKLNQVDEAMQRRVVAIPFTSKFLDEAKYNEIKNPPSNVFIADTKITTDEFKNKNRQALFMILMKHYTSDKMPTIPEECKQLTSQYMQSSDDVFSWFQDKYEQNEKGCFPLKDVYAKFTSSEYYSNMNKPDKRNMNLTSFMERLDKNPFLHEYIKRRDSRHNGLKFKKDMMIGWSEKQEDEDEEKDECAEYNEE